VRAGSDEGPLAGFTFFLNAATFLIMTAISTAQSLHHDGKIGINPSPEMQPRAASI
jgi:hypothetical protein